MAQKKVTLTDQSAISLQSASETCLVNAKNPAHGLTFVTTRLLAVKTICALMVISSIMWELVLNQMSAALQKAQKPASTGTVDDGNANASSSLVLKGPMAMLALSALCLLVVLAIMHFYQKFQKNSKGYTVVVNKAG